jgi:hypothetical protein
MKEICEFLPVFLIQVPTGLFWSKIIHENSEIL